MRRTGPSRGRKQPLASYAVAAVLALGAPAFSIGACSRHDRTGVAVGQSVPAFSLVNWDGRRISPETLRGKRTIIAFTYAKCELACPLITTRLKMLDQTIHSPPDIAYLHVSVNPEEDTTDEIRRHFADHGIDPEQDPRWLFARGDDAGIRDALSKFAITVQKKPVGESFLIEHTIRVWVIDRSGRLVAGFDDYAWDDEEMVDALGS